MTDPVSRQDVIIAGGGMVGAALACALGDAGFRVTVIETRAPLHDWNRDEIDNRVSALTHASRHLLENLGVWQRINALGAAAYHEMHVWDRSGLGEIHFDAAAIGEPDLGHIVQNRVIQLALWERMAELPSVTIRCPGRIGALEAGQPAVTLDDGARLQAPLVVAADGARSALRELAGIGVTVRSFHQRAVVATVRVSQGHRRTAWQRFLPAGPLAFLPVDATDRCTVVWSTSPGHAEHLLGCDDSAFCQALGEASEHRLGAVLETGPRASFPLRSQLADRAVDDGLALVGDAAHVIHPLAGQGVNLGFLDVATLADVLSGARDAGRPIGTRATLRRYERARKADTLALMRAMEAFNLLFSNTRLPLSLVRNLGLRLTDTAAPLKNLLMRRAIGRSPELPPLARPAHGAD